MPSSSTLDMRRQLLDAALTVLRRDGAEGLTVRHVAVEAGCSTTGIYTHFGGKQGLVEAIFLEGFDSFDEALLPLYEKGDVLAAGRTYRTWALANPTHYLVMFGRAVPDFTPSEPAMERANRSFAALVEAVGGHTGVTDPMIAAYHLYATVHGYVMLELIDMGPVGTADRDSLYESGLLAALAGLS
ncbi:MAG: TetR/AcrR family transcriptional regulator [Actinomycetota bacterium]